MNARLSIDIFGEGIPYIMTEYQQDKIKGLLEKYNDILLVSMRLAIAEDFTNLIVLNKEDSDFALKDFLQEKEEFSNYILRQFLKQNSSPITSKLGEMSEPKLTLQKQTKIKFKFK